MPPTVVEYAIQRTNACTRTHTGRLLRLGNCTCAFLLTDLNSPHHQRGTMGIEVIERAPVTHHHNLHKT